MSLTSLAANPKMPYAKHDYLGWLGNEDLSCLIGRV